MTKKKYPPGGICFTCKIKTQGCSLFRVGTSYCSIFKKQTTQQEEEPMNAEEMKQALEDAPDEYTMLTESESEEMPHIILSFRISDEDKAVILTTRAIT